MARWVVKALDVILEHWEKAGSRHAVESVKDWEILQSVWKLWKKAYPHEYAEFSYKIKQTRAAHLNKHGSSAKGLDGGQVRHIADIPGRFDTMLKIFYPQQVYSKNFLHKLIKYIPDMKAPDKV